MRREAINPATRCSDSRSLSRTYGDFGLHEQPEVGIKNVAIVPKSRIQRIYKRMGNDKPHLAQTSHSEVDLLQNEPHDNPDSCCITSSFGVLYCTALPYNTLAKTTTDPCNAMSRNANRSYAEKTAEGLMQRNRKLHNTPDGSINSVRHPKERY